MADYATIEIEAELVGATGGTLSVFLQSSDVELGTWYDVIAFQTLAAGTNSIIFRTALSRYATTDAAPTVVGKNGFPALAPSSSIQAGFGDRLRLFMKPGVGTTIGAPVLVNITGYRWEARKV